MHQPGLVVTLMDGLLSVTPRPLQCRSKYYSPPSHTPTFTVILAYHRTEAQHLRPGRRLVHLPTTARAAAGVFRKLPNGFQVRCRCSSPISFLHGMVPSRALTIPSPESPQAPRSHVRANGNPANKVSVHAAKGWVNRNSPIPGALILVNLMLRKKYDNQVGDASFIRGEEGEPASGAYK
ncbi:hypothetical protein BJV78DRAFT_699030 [Lactifluus subvellereus]|nr:hypothetical protein BJV78DRAFT_699030 [Lactifluus subvellereus]